ncbi:alpha/beta fold hydrolase [bacterium]|nr:alpha/beta fold hydrolase [bacterium]
MSDVSEIIGASSGSALNFLEKVKRFFTLLTADGLYISGWFLPGKENSNTQKDTGFLLVHGYGENRDGMLDQAAYLNKKHGFSVLLIDLRGHGKSSNSFYTYGVTEAEDIRAGLLYLKQNLSDQALIGAWGFSAGVKSIIQALDLQKTTLDFAILESVPLCELLEPSLDVIFVECMKLQKCNLVNSSDTEIFKNIDIPMLVVAGEREGTILENLRWMENHFSHSLSRGLVIPGANHGGCWKALFKTETDRFVSEMMSYYATE